MKIPKRKYKRKGVTHIPVWAVYEIRCIKNGRLYIGSSTDVFARFGEHYKGMAKLTKRSKTNPNMMRDFQLYGASAFEFRVLVPMKVKCEKTLRETEERIINQVPAELRYNILLTTNNSA